MSTAVGTSRGEPADAREQGGGLDGLSPEARVGILEATAMRATRAAALACQEWVGRGDPKAADSAATEAMRTALADAPGTGCVVIGEGEKDDAPMLYNGERLGSGAGPDFDIAVDPLECTKFCAAALPGAFATISVGETDSFWSPGPAFYMDKLVVPAPARGVIDIDAEPEKNLERVAEALDKPLESLQVVVLDKPRHEKLIERIRASGASVSTPADGDVAGALAALLPDGEADILMGVGGTPEGVMTACAARALGGGMQGRLAPQDDEERQALEEAGMEIDRVLELDELVRGDALFAATGVTGGPLARRPWSSDGATMTDSILITAGSVRRIIESSFGALVPGITGVGPNARGSNGEDNS